MTCTIATILSCLSLSGLYVDAEVIHSNRGEARLVSQTHQEVIHTKYGPQVFDVTTFDIADSSQNPYGRISIGYEIDWGRFQTRLDYSHESSLDTNSDRGTERLSIGVTWRPFR